MKKSRKLSRVFADERKLRLNMFLPRASWRPDLRGATGGQVMTGDYRHRSGQRLATAATVNGGCGCGCAGQVRSGPATTACPPWFIFLVVTRSHEFGFGWNLVEIHRTSLPDLSKQPRTFRDEQKNKTNEHEQIKKSEEKKRKLHPCIETLNSRNLGLAKDSFKVSFGFRTLWGPRLIKDPKNVKNHWFYCVFAQKC